LGADRSNAVKLRQWAFRILNYAILPMKTLKHQSSSASPTAVRTADMSGWYSPSNRRKSDFKTQLYERHGYFDRVNGIVDHKLGKVDPARFYSLPLETQVRANTLVGAYILPHAVRKKLMDDSEVTFRDIWALFHGEHIDPNMLDHPKNGILMSNDDHMAFGSFFFVLDPLIQDGRPIPDQYQRVYIGTPAGTPIGGVILREHRLERDVFDLTPVDASIPPPAAKLLELHAAAGRVICAAGAAHIFEGGLDDDAFNPGVLPSDGGVHNADLIQDAFYRRGIVAF